MECHSVSAGRRRRKLDHPVDQWTQNIRHDSTSKKYVTSSKERGLLFLEKISLCACSKQAVRNDHNIGEEGS